VLVPIGARRARARCAQPSRPWRAQSARAHPVGMKPRTLVRARRPHPHPTRSVDRPTSRTGYGGVPRRAARLLGGGPPASDRAGRSPTTTRESNHGPRSVHRSTRDSGTRQSHSATRRCSSSRPPTRMCDTVRQHRPATRASAVSSSRAATSTRTGGASKFTPNKQGSGPTTPSSTSSTR